MNLSARYRPVLACLLVSASGAAVAQGSASLTLSGMGDSDSGWGYGVDAHVAPIEQWSVGAGFAKSESGAPGEEFAGESLQLRTDVNLGRFFAGLHSSRWEDTQLDSDSLQGSAGWLFDTGIAFTALVDDRDLTVRYQVRSALNPARPSQVVFNGTGLGADLSYFGEHWMAGARFVAYRYGNSLARVRAVINTPTTEDFPRLQALLDSILTRTAGAPERELSVMLGRTLRRTSLQGEWLVVRDALTQSDIHSLSLGHELRINTKVTLQTTLGFSAGSGADSIGFGGLALTLKR